MHYPKTNIPKLFVTDVIYLKTYNGCSSIDHELKQHKQEISSVNEEKYFWLNLIQEKLKIKKSFYDRVDEE